MRNNTHNNMDSVEVNISQDIDSGSEVSEITDNGMQKPNMLPWKIVCVVLVLLVILGWVGIIALLILKEEWQLVLVAWLLLYAAVHFCYWYCRRHSSRTLTAQLRQQVFARVRGTDPSALACGDDRPPSYDELVKSEVPPPAYYSVVNETPKLRRFFKVQALALPWFLKKKSLEQASKNGSTSSVNDITTVVEPVSEDSAAGTSVTGPAYDQSRVSSVRKSSNSESMEVSSVPGSVALTINSDEEGTLELPSYQTLMRERLEPVLTPIHRALAALPSTQGSLPPPPPYSPRQLDTITEANEQQQQQQRNE